MDNQQYRSQSQQQERRQQQYSFKQKPLEQGSRECPHCHRAINDTCELCPYCGLPVAYDHCTFCGEPYEADEPFCCECGSPRDGIRCPQCGTLAFRSFCPKCNAPLNDNAQQALQLARQDPKFQRAQRLSDEMASMEAYLLAFKAEIEDAMAMAEMEEDDGPQAPGLSDEGLALQAKYAQLMQLLGNVKVPQQQPAKKAAERPAFKRRQQIKAKFVDIDQVMEAYKAKAAEMQAALRDLLPDPSMTPAMQRDYACARKVATVVKEQVRVGQYWECNLCHCLHNMPSECAEPSLGGTWHYETITVEKRVWDYLK